MRIATWSGPRNLSTAMMYSFGARHDFFVCDEPFYGAYLKQTGVQHPMNDEILAGMETEPVKIAERLTGSIPEKKPHFYQKHMCHHMISGIDYSWMRSIKNVFLIRHPARVIASYAAKRENPTLEDIGFVQQAKLYHEARGFKEKPLVIDSYDLRQNPRGMIEALCDALGLAFDPAMLNWPKGGHAQDGIWARHWYGAVHNSTGFAGAEGDLPNLKGDLSKVVDLAMPFYEELAECKISL